LRHGPRIPRDQSNTCFSPTLFILATFSFLHRWVRIWSCLFASLTVFVSTSFQGSASANPNDGGRGMIDVHYCVHSPRMSRCAPIMGRTIRTPDLSFGCRMLSV
jgi:hypothetical protein